MIENLKRGGIVSIRDYLLKQQSEGKKICRTESGDPSFQIPQNVKQAITDAVNKNKTHYTAGEGIKELRQTVYEKVKNENRISINDYSNVIITNGAMNGLFCVYSSICEICNSKFRDPVRSNTEILVPRISWTETFQNIEMVGGKPVFFNIDPFSETPVNVDELEKLITYKTEAISLNTPHNPTGKVINKNILQDIVNLCIKYNFWLVMDEAYEHIIYSPHNHTSAGSLSDYDKIISIFSCSKSYAMSGLRVGYIICKNKELMDKVSKYVRCSINGVSSICQWGALSAMTETPKKYFIETNKKYFERRKLLFDGISKCSFLEPLFPDGAFYIWAKIKDNWQGFNGRKDSWGLTAMLLEQGIGSAPGAVFGPGGEGNIRFSFSCADEYIDLAAKRLSEL